MSKQNQDQQSPLIQVEFEELDLTSNKLQVQELPFQGHINLRGCLNNKDFVSATERILGLSLEMENNTFVENDFYTLLWYGPDEWLILTRPGEEMALLESLRSALGETFAAVTDVTGGNTVLEISGSSGRDLLSCGSMIDFHPSNFSAGSCVQTLFAKTNVTILHLSKKDVYRMILRRSFADYLGTWIIDAARGLELD